MEKLNPERKQTRRAWEKSCAHQFRPRRPKLIGVSCTEEMFAAIERYIVEEKSEISRPEAIRQILRKALIEAGHFNPQE
jgi:hypothetical protein